MEKTTVTRAELEEKISAYTRDWGFTSSTCWADIIREGNPYKCCAMGSFWALRELLIEMDLESDAETSVWMNQ